MLFWWTVYDMLWLLCTFCLVKNLCLIVPVPTLTNKSWSMNDLIVLDAEHCLNVLAAHSPKAGSKLWKDYTCNLQRALNFAEKFVSTRSMTCLPSGKKMDVKNVPMNLSKNC